MDTARDRVLASLRTIGEQCRCAICLELFTDPVLLPCSHVFCRFAAAAGPLPAQRRAGRHGVPSVRTAPAVPRLLRERLLAAAARRAGPSTGPAPYTRQTRSAPAPHAAAPPARPRPFACIRCNTLFRGTVCAHRGHTAADRSADFRAHGATTGSCASVLPAPPLVPSANTISLRCRSPRHSAETASRS